MLAFFHGFVLALGLILPLGVQNVFIFNQGSVQKRFSNCLPAILSATLSDALLIIMAVMGVSVIVMKITIFKYILLSVGVVFLIYMGFITWRTKEKSDQQNKAAVPLSAKKQIVFALSVSLFNPHAILDTIGVIGSSSIHYQGLSKFIFTSAGILVSFIWFCFLAYAGGMLKKIHSGVIPIINKIAAMIIWGSAIYLVIQFAQS